MRTHIKGGRGQVQDGRVATPNLSRLGRLETGLAFLTLSAPLIYSPLLPQTVRLPTSSKCHQGGKKKEKGSCPLLAQTNFLQKHSGEKAEATGFYV